MWAESWRLPSGEMYFVHLCRSVSLRNITHLVGLGPRLCTYREDANALQSSDVLVKILCVGSNIMTCSDGCFQYILGGPILEVGAVRDVDRPFVPMERLVYFGIFQVVVFELKSSASLLDGDVRSQNTIPSSSKAKDLQPPNPSSPSHQNRHPAHGYTS